MPPIRRARICSLCILLFCAALPSDAQTTASLEGYAFDMSGAVVPDVLVDVRDESTGFAASDRTDPQGRYRIAAIPPGTYTVVAEARGFRVEIVNELLVETGRALIRDFHLSVGGAIEKVEVRADVPLVDRATATVSHIVTDDTMRNIPLNGRHFMDLALLVPGAVAPSQAGFSSRPVRGVGALAFNVAGNREEAVAFLVNGVTTNNLTFGSLIFEPPLGSIREVKVDTSGVAPAYGHVSGATVNIVSQSGSDAFHGDLFEFLRNDALDARNFFAPASSGPQRFERHQFGGSLGGPIRRGRTFFFAVYEGVRQRQAMDMNSLVLSDEQRASATDPSVRRLMSFIPHATVVDRDGTPRFVGSAPVAVDTDRWTIDLRHRVGTTDRLQAFYGSQLLRANEPGAQGTSIPGFGLKFHPNASILTLGETHLFGAAIANELRFGRSRLIGGSLPATQLNPADFGIGNGVNRPIGLPQMIVAGDLSFGGPGALPQGRRDTLYVVNDVFNRATARHWITLGGEYRHFVNQNVAEGTGVFNFPSVDAFLNGTANAFNITLGERRSVIDQRGLSLFFQDRVPVTSRVTLDLGVRYEWNVTPTERDRKFVVFDPDTASLLRVGIDRGGAIYRQNSRNVEPRIGAAWDLSGAGRTVLRAAYARAVDEPSTTAVRDTAANPPFAVPLAASGAIPIGRALEAVQPAGLAPTTIDAGFRNPSVNQWNANAQHQFARDAVVTIGYFGSRGGNLRISRNINQPTGGVRPFAALSSSSPILPGTSLGNVTQVDSIGFSSYRALWMAVTKRLSRGLSFDGSYTWSRSLDTNSLNSSGFAVQDAFNIRGEYGLSDFDARHRFVVNAAYDLPFSRHTLIRGWQVATVVQAQSGNPVNIVTSNSRLNGSPNTVRPDITGPVRIIGAAERWFDPSVFVAVDRFGNAPRNAVSGPGFRNVDLSISRRSGSDSRVGYELRVDVFDLFNHVNFGPPGNIVGSPTFGKITRTRLPTGEAGSSRQLQLAIRMSF